MSISIGAIALLGRLIFDVVKWAKEDTKQAENNRELDSGDKKHKYVEQGIRHKIKKYDLRDEHKALCKEEIAAAKEEAMKHIDHKIKEVVDIHHKTGEFVR
jgi:hypothetical protein